MRITIPKDEAEAREVADATVLNGWALAGWVASQVRLSEHGGDRKSIKTKSSLDRRISTAQFAAKGIRGLKSKDTVRLYAELWRDHVGAPPKPGEVLDIPELEWPPSPKQADEAAPKTTTGRRTAATNKQPAEDVVGRLETVDTAPDPLSGNTVERLPLEHAIREASHARGQITDKLMEASRLLNQVNGDWNEYRSSVNLMIARSLFSSISAELGVLGLNLDVNPIEIWEAEGRGSL